MKKLGQFLLMIAAVLLAAQPVLAELSTAPGCGMDMPQCMTHSACCGGDASAVMPTSILTTLDAPATMPCHPQSCFTQAPDREAIPVALNNFKLCSALSAIREAAPTTSTALLHRPPHPEASAPSRSVLFQVFRI